ncbi:MAG: hypothetical protein AB7C97_13640 [Oscillospiraceae bacterium]
MNKRIGMISSIVTLLAVLSFALAMIIGSDLGSYLSSMFIAWGFVPLICSFASYGKKERAAMGYTAIAFAAVYAVFIMMVYFAQLTAVRLGGLNEQAARIIDYETFGLFFSYDLLGYAFMALSTFFIAFTINPKRRADRALRVLLWIHGVFAISCVIMPMLGLFSTDMAGGDLIGVLVLEFWCAFFTPVCMLSYHYFKKFDY